jgi:hypothetical protein
MKKSICHAAAVLLLSGCVSNFDTGLKQEVASADFTKITSNSIEGEMCNTNLFFLPRLTYSVRDVAKEYGFKKIHWVEYRTKHYFLIAQTCVVVYGDM